MPCAARGVPPGKLPCLALTAHTFTSLHQWTMMALRFAGPSAKLARQASVRRGPWAAVWRRPSCGNPSASPRSPADLRLAAPAPGTPLSRHLHHRSLQGGRRGARSGAEHAPNSPPSLRTALGAGPAVRHSPDRARSRSQTVPNYINGKFVQSKATEHLDLTNPVRLA